MFGPRLTLFKLVGFEIRVDMSWLVLAFLITWSLAVGFFPHFYDGLAPATYWWMGVAGAIGLFASIVFHELGHSIIARKYGIPMKGITLFIFGGVAEMDREPPTPKSEFMMAIAGPIASAILVAVFYLVFIGGQAANLPLSIVGVFGYLALINTILIIFNMVPAFPLDGGRVLRSLLWGWSGSLRWATRVASRIGGAFGFLLMGLGIFAFITGNFIGGVWWFILGLFIRAASQMSYQQVLLRRALEGEPVSRFMHSEPITVPPSTTVRELVDNYVYKHHYKMFPVVENGSLIGCLHLDQVKQIPVEEWDQTRASQLAKPCSKENIVSPETDAVKALSAMNRNQSSRLMVVDKDHLVGILALRDLMDFLSLKIELEEG